MTMDEQDFAQRLDSIFGTEPVLPAVEDQVRRGRHALGRRRVSVAAGVSTLALLGAVGATMLPEVDRHSLQPTDHITALSEDEVAQRCLLYNAVSADHPALGNGKTTAQAIFGEPKLLTRQSTDRVVMATVLAADGKHWGACQLSVEPDNGIKDLITVYATKVQAETSREQGDASYVPWGDQQVDAEHDIPWLPRIETGCVGSDAVERSVARAENAQCTTYTMTWSDRRVPDVASVRIVTPDGRQASADVKNGYLAMSYQGRMTPEVSALIAAGDFIYPQQITFFDRDGAVLATQRWANNQPVGEAALDNFPSLSRPIQP